MNTKINKLITVALGLIAFLAFSSIALASAPTVQTLAPSVVSQTSVTLNGFYNAGGNDTDVWFDYGTSPSLGQSTPSITEPGDGANNFHQTISVTPGTTVYFRAMGISAGGVAHGLTLSFLVPAYQMPTVMTLAQTSVTYQNATLKGFYNSNGSNTYTWFEYGTTNALGSVTTSVNQGTTFGNTTDTITVSPNTTYFYRIAAKNSAGIVHGSPIISFTTPSAPATPTQCVINSFTANPQTVNYGFSSTLSYATSGNCDHVAISNIGIQTATTGTAYTGVLYTNTSFTLTASGPNNTASPATITISVIPNSNNGGNGNGGTNTGGGTIPPVYSAPSAYTSPATEINKNTAVLNGVVIASNTVNTTGYFEWGTSANTLYNTTPVQNLGNYSSVSFYTTLTNLSANTTYFYRAVAVNAYGVHKGNIESFKTKSATVVSTGTTTHTSSSGVTPNKTKTNDAKSSLTASAIFGDSFLPSSIIGWLILALIILGIVVLARAIYKPAMA